MTLSKTQNTGRGGHRLQHSVIHTMLIGIGLCSCLLPQAKTSTGEERLKLGIDRIAEYRSLFTGQRVGLITNQTGISTEGRSSVAVLAQYTNLAALFSPEHGIQGYTRDGVSIENSRDPTFDLPIYSLYGKTKRPTQEMLEDIDILCFDIQDIGARFYTYISTMAYAMEECARYHKHFVVFDRPNPIGGAVVEGNMLEDEYRSFTGCFPITQRHGMTIGELALLFNTEYGIRCQLTVVPMQGWKREHYFDDLPLIWVPPSPNIPSSLTALIYAGICIFEGTNISVGRGTTMPFQYIGAPFIDGNRLADTLNAMKLDGVHFLPAFFTPSLSHYADELCQGVQIAVTNGRTFSPVKTAVSIFYTLRRLYPDDFKIKNEGKKYCGLHLLTGCTQLTDRSQTEQDYFIRMDKESADFNRIRQPYLLY